MTPETIEMLQAALAGEHAAIYGYGVVGSHLDENDQARARAAYDSHRARRGALDAILRERGVEPVAAQPVYGLPFPVTDGDSARQLAGLLEDRLAAVYADLVLAADTNELRENAARWLTEVAVRASSWTGTTVAFPGLQGSPS